MSDYLFQLESHVTPAQREIVATVERVAAERGQPVFLVGGAMRDMLGGFPITDLDFAVQGDAAKIAGVLISDYDAALLETDKLRQTWEIRCPNGVSAEIGMARSERFPSPGKDPVVEPVSIHEDLLRRDFTMNSIAISLHPASRGLLLDPTNGAGDIERREIRSVDKFGFYDDPVRLLRLVRLKVRLGFDVHPRTQRQYDNAREAGVEAQIAPRALFRELRAISGELNLVETVSALDKAGLLVGFSPALKNQNLHLSGLARLEKARQLIPFGVELNLEHLGLFMYLLTSKLSPAERSAMNKRLGLRRGEADLWQKLEARSAKLERDVKSRRMRRPSNLYQRLKSGPGDEILFLLLHSKERIVRDRIRNFLQKHLYTVVEVTDREVTSLTGVKPGSPQFIQLKEDLIAARLDGRKWEPPVRPEPEPQPEEAKPKKRGARKKARTQPPSNKTAPSSPGSKKLKAAAS